MKATLFALFAFVIPVSQGLTESPALPMVPWNLAEFKTIPEPCPRSDSSDPKRYMIAWNDGPGIDGSYILVIHPSQIFLRSSHNNPNPNYVYWVAPLSDEQYARLSRYLDGYKGKLFLDHKKLGYWQWDGAYVCYSLSRSWKSPWSEEVPDEKEWKKKSDEAANRSLRLILKELNEGLAPSAEKLLTDATINRFPNISRIEDTRRK